MIICQLVVSFSISVKISKNCTIFKKLTFLGYHVNSKMHFFDQKMLGFEKFQLYDNCKIYHLLSTLKTHFRKISLKTRKNLLFSP